MFLLEEIVNINFKVWKKKYHIASGKWHLVVNCIGYDKDINIHNAAGD